MTQIIRGDPQEALRLAVDEEKLNNLPPFIAQHMEQWVYDFVDMESVHVCYNPEHPGLIKRWATLSNGERLRAWVYGNRKNIPSANGVATWGGAD